MTDHPLLSIPQSYHAGKPRGITSVCSAHPLVIEAALRLAKERDRPALIEATCNQVNQDGGYTGMTPADFRTFVENIAARCGYDPARIILGGDHLGPNPWKSLPPKEAMEKAEALIAAYAEAGFTKLHLDTSMGCDGEPPALDDAVTAERAARLAAIAEAQSTGAQRPVYVIGTEVPVPGGAAGALHDLDITTPSAVQRTAEVHQHAFEALGLSDAFARVIALVVQPGVEFGDTEVVHFDPAKAADLSRSLNDRPSVVFEAHSTDYQTQAELAALVRNGFAILKVGPWLTFALREALYALDAIADVMEGETPSGRLMRTMEEVMQADPSNWRKYYEGDARQLWLKRHFSLSDRIRYYWPAPDAAAAVDMVLSRVGGTMIPGPVLSQYLPFAESMTGRDALLEAVQRVLRMYDDAATPA